MLRKLFTQARRFITNIMLLPIHYIFVLPIYPNIVAKRFFTQTPDYRLNPDTGEAVLYHPGNAESGNYHHYAPVSFLWPFFSLKAYARNIVKKIKELDENEAVKEIRVTGLSMGAAATILALDLLIKEDIKLKKPISFWAANTFSSLHDVIIEQLSSNQSIFQGLASILAGIVLFLASFIFTIPNATWTFFVLLGTTLAIPALVFSFTDKRLSGNSQKVIINSLRTALCCFLLLNCGYSFYLPIIIHVFTDPSLGYYPLYILLESSGSNMSISNAVKRIRTSDSKLSAVLMTSQVHNDPVLKGATLFKKQKDSPDDVEGADYYITNHSNHMELPPEAPGFTSHFAYQPQKA